MEIYPDYKEMLRLFGAHKVSYVIVGGYARVVFRIYDLGFTI